ncbi:MAG: prenyltransferase/squalene oxidase repeat-containing protein [Candidatus Bathyarchaeia archaeon]
MGRLISGFKYAHNELWIERVVKYIVQRQNDDGGYAFCQGTDSNAQDTYYALATLNLLNAEYPNVKQTIEWLRNFASNNIYAHYYVAKALILCNSAPQDTLERFLPSLMSSEGIFGTLDVYSEVASEFLFTYMATELFRVAKKDVGIKQKIVNHLCQCMNRNGGFGVHDNSNINSTYHALASLANLGYPVKSLKKTLSFVRACEKPYGGFTLIPNNSSPYMEHVYYGLAALELLGERPQYAENTWRFIMKCQNANGGFARSEIGISTFENTFYAVSSLRILNMGGVPPYEY